MKRRVRSAIRWVMAEEVRGEEPPPPASNANAPAETSVVPGRATDTAEEEPTASAAATPHPRLRFWVALGVVVAATSTAAGAWRAEIFTEYATQKDALARQALTGLQLSERSDEQSTMAEFRQFGAYEHDFSFSHQLQREANHSSHGANVTGTEAQNEALLAAAKLDGFTFVDPGSQGQAARLEPTQVYKSTLFYDDSLATFDPGDLTRQASRARSDAVDMAGVTVFFAAAVVLLTLSEMMLRRRGRNLEERWSSGHVLAAGSLVVWVGAAVLFVLLYLDVPHLK